MQVRLHKNTKTIPKIPVLIQANSEPNTLTGSALRSGRGYHRPLETRDSTEDRSHTFRSEVELQTTLMRPGSTTPISLNKPWVMAAPFRL